MKKEPKPALIGTILEMLRYGIRLKQDGSGFIKCPKHDRKTGRCKIYQKRPELCQIWYCFKPQDFPLSSKKPDDGIQTSGPRSGGLV